MYRNLAKFRVKIHPRSRGKTELLNCRSYHTDGVYGYKAKTKKTYIAPLEYLESRNQQSNFYRFVTAYKEHGHKDADINPVMFNREVSSRPELDPERYGLSLTDKVLYKGILNVPGQNEGTISEAIDFLKTVYSQTISAEFQYLEKEDEREWFAERMERLSDEIVDEETKILIGIDLIKSQNFDKFLGNKFSSLKRYGGEGAESMMAFFSEFFKIASQDGVEQVVLGMPHRGRLNLLTGMLNFPPAKLFRKLKGLPDFPENFKATGDVISHFISTTDLNYHGKLLHVSLLYNPSHLEAINPVSMGKTRAKQMMSEDGDYGHGRWSDKIVNLQIHGDGAYIGQGVNQECLALSGAPHFEIGGTIHLVVNNQLGFTTPADRGRSSRYCTDLAKIISAPVIHVNGDYPEMVVKATRLATEYQRKYRRDVFIDMNCYRQWGHNELDDPTFTNPALYSIIRSRRTVPDSYAEKLIRNKILSKDAIQDIINDHTAWLNTELKNSESYQPEAPCFQKQWSGFEQAPHALTTWDTGLDYQYLQHIAEKSVFYPRDFNIHPTLLKSHVQARLTKIYEGTKIDWASAEAMAFGSLLLEGYNVRISGQDVGRGTFSQRHIMLVDQKTNTIHIPLNHLDEHQKAHLEIASSILSEEAVLGFEYGMSIEHPNNLIIWEAQFGDFFNGAQIILDTFVSSGETKWLWSSGLVCLLPHGYDGAGPEHSSSRIERFLQLTDSKENKPDGDDVNMHVVYPSTPAQYFHLLRRQMLRNFRKPLIIIGPKTLLRLSAATSSHLDLAPSTSFKPVIGDVSVKPNSVRKIILCSGKHYYNLEEYRKTLSSEDTAIVRIESLCPFPVLQLQEEIDKYPNVKNFIWSQEEPQNMGAWSFIKPRFENLLGKRIRYTGRETLAAPAVGVGQWHQQQSLDVVQKPFHIKI